MGVPADFVTFVATYGRPLTMACREITGNDRLAERLRLDLLATAALRWRRVPGSRRLPGLSSRQRRVRRAVTRLDRQLRTEVRGYRLFPAPAGTPDRARLSYVDTKPLSTVDSAALSTVESAAASTVDAAALAAAAWREAARLRRQAALAVTAAGLALALFALVGPRSAAPGPVPPPEPDLPPRVQVLPRATALAQLPPTTTTLPAALSLTPPPSTVSTPAQSSSAAPPSNASSSAAPPAGSSSTVDLGGRAVAVLRSGSGPLTVLGADGSSRQVTDARLLTARLLSTSLSPDGDRVVLPLGGDLLVLTVATGAVTLVPAGATQPEPPALAWRDGHSVVVPALDGAHQLDLDAGSVTALPGVTGVDVVTGRDRRLTELLAVSSATGQSSRIRLWRSDPGGAARDTEDRPTYGPQWIGVWTGPGWGSEQLFARACDPGSIALPTRYGVARSAVAALGSNGTHAGTLVAVDATLTVLGFLDQTTVLLGAQSARTLTVVAWSPATAALTRLTTSPTPLTLTLTALPA